MRIFFINVAEIPDNILYGFFFIIFWQIQGKKQDIWLEYIGVGGFHATECLKRRQNYVGMSDKRLLISKAREFKMYSYTPHISTHTVKTGLIFISFPQTVPLQITDLLNKYWGKIAFVYWHKFVCVFTQMPFFRIRTQTVLVLHFQCSYTSSI